MCYVNSKYSLLTRTQWKKKFCSNDNKHFEFNIFVFDHLFHFSDDVASYN